MERFTNDWRVLAVGLGLLVLTIDLVIRTFSDAVARRLTTPPELRLRPSWAAFFRMSLTGFHSFPPLEGWAPWYQDWIREHKPCPLMRAQIGIASLAAMMCASAIVMWELIVAALVLLHGFSGLALVGTFASCAVLMNLMVKHPFFRWLSPLKTPLRGVYSEQGAAAHITAVSAALTVLYVYFRS